MILLIELHHHLGIRLYCVYKNSENNYINLISKSAAFTMLKNITCCRENQELYILHQSGEDITIETSGIFPKTTVG